MNNFLLFKSDRLKLL